MKSHPYCQLSYFTKPCVKGEIMNLLYSCIPDVSCVMIIINMMYNMNDENIREFYQSLWGKWGCSGKYNIYYLTPDINGNTMKYKNKRKGWGWKLPTIPQRLLRDIHLIGHDIYSYLPIKLRLSILHKYQYDLYIYNPYYLSDSRNDLYINIIKEFLLEDLKNIWVIGWRYQTDINDINYKINHILKTTMRKWVTHNIIDNYDNYD